MTYPLVRDLAAEGIPVRLTCGTLGFSPQAYYAWLAQPVTDRDWNDATSSTRSWTRTPTTRSSATGS